LARDASNNVLAGVPVTFTASSGAIQVTQPITDAAGVATATVSTGGDSSLRTITVTGSTAALTSTVQVKVVTPPTPTTPVYAMGNGTGTGFVSGTIGLSVSGSLAAGGTTALQVSIVDQTGTLYTASAVTVNFNSPCIASGLSEILPSGSTTGTGVTNIVTSTGSISATYAAKGCSGSDTITATATVAGQSLSATGNVMIAAASIGSIQFISATPVTIGLKGTGLNETSTVVFKVTDSTGGARAGVTVTFALNTTVGGMSISPSSATSASDGTVQTVVSAGTVHTAVRVTASIASPALSTQSSQLSVTTGLPASGAFSIAVGAPTAGGGKDTIACPNVETWNIDGIQIPVTVRLADRYNNPVPDGTAVAFYTNGGHIGGSCTTGPPLAPAGDGSCSVTWTSANPRPTTADSPPVSGNGRAQILATAVGEESFTDQNASGFYQAGDPFSNLGEPFLSANETPNYILGDYFLDYNQNGKWDGPSGNFVGISCTGTSASSTCTTSTLAIGASHLMIMSTSNAVASLLIAGSTNFTNSGTASAPVLSISLAGSKGSGTVQIHVEDGNGNSMGAGTTIAFGPFTNAAVGSVSQTPNPFVVGCAADVGPALQPYQATFTAIAQGSGTLPVTITSPNGSITVLNIPVTVNP
jgi:hypothetical protein